MHCRGQKRIRSLASDPTQVRSSLIITLYMHWSCCEWWIQFQYSGEHRRCGLLHSHQWGQQRRLGVPMGPIQEVGCGRRASAHSKCPRLHQGPTSAGGKLNIKPFRNITRWSNRIRLLQKYLNHIYSAEVRLQDRSIAFAATLTHSENVQTVFEYVKTNVKSITQSYVFTTPTSTFHTQTNNENISIPLQPRQRPRRR